MTNRRWEWLRWLVAAVVVAFVLDLGTRLLARWLLGVDEPDVRGSLPRPPVPIGEHLSLHYGVNRGQAFGVAAQSIVRTVVGLASVLVLIDSILHSAKRQLRNRGLMIWFGIILATRLVTFLERLVLGGDSFFVSFHIGSLYAPPVNLGDIAAVIAGAGVTSCLLILVPQSQYWTSRISSFRRWSTFGGTVIRAVTVPAFALSGGLAVSALVNTIKLVRHDGAGMWAEPSPTEYVTAIAIEAIVAVGLFLLAGYLQMLGRRLQQPRLEEIIKSDSRKPVVVLRSFKRDQIKIRRRSWLGRLAIWRNDYLLDSGSWTFERALVPILETVGPAVALGSPTDNLTPFGAARTYLPHTEWKERVIALTEDAGLCVVIVEDSPSLRWELEHLSKHPGLPRLVLIPATVVSPDSSPTSWATIREACPFLPELEPDTVAVTFSRDGTPRCHRVTATGAWARLDGMAAAISEQARS